MTSLTLRDLGFVAAGQAATVGQPLLLDTYSGASAAYSLQLLRTAYTGPVVRVRRSSDSTEQDFTAAQVTNGTLTTFTGVGDGFVRTWYDQSGNGFHAAQTTAANQPQIVSSGTVITKGGRPSIKFDGSLSNDNLNDRLTNASISVAQPVTHFIVASRDSTTQNADVILDSFSDAVGHSILNVGSTEAPSQSWMLSAGALISTATPATTNLVLLSALANGASSSLRTNGAQRTTGNAGANALSGLSLGNLRGNPNPITIGTGVYALTGNISEVIIYSGNQSASFSAIEADINGRYSIY